MLFLIPFLLCLSLTRALHLPRLPLVGRARHHSLDTTDTGEGAITITQFVTITMDGADIQATAATNEMTKSRGVHATSTAAASKTNEDTDEKADLPGQALLDDDDTDDSDDTDDTDGDSKDTQKNPVTTTQGAFSSTLAAVHSDSASPTADATAARMTVPTTTAASAPNATTAVTPGDCKCGYVLSAYDNAWFPQLKTFSFSTIQTTSALTAAGWQISEWPIGGTSPAGVKCQGKTENIKFADGAMELIVPANQFTGAEITFNTPILGGVLTMNAQLDKTPGTCQSIFTYAVDAARGDEQDIEILGANMNTNGIETTNWDPASASTATNRKNSVGGQNVLGDLSAAYHKYTIGWLPGGTKYYFDGAAIGSPKGYSSVNPSHVILNNWSNGDPGFTQGPPTKDTILRVKYVEMYYTTESGQNLPSGCTLEQACKV